MGLLEQFEHPLPMIKCSADKITIEKVPVDSKEFDGSFIIHNVGGGELSGTIKSNSRAITFYPEQFTGNKIEVSYISDTSIYKIGDIIHTSALVMSNGGELVIPVHVKIMPPAIVTRSKEKISSLKEFLWYTKTSPVAARQLFTQAEFMMWLFSMGYEHMELYEHFVTDPNKERAVDNFLVLNKLKKRSKLILEQDDIRIKIPSYSKDIITGVIPLKRSGWGYIDVILTIEPEYPWIILNKNKITSTDFDDEGNSGIDFFVNPTKLYKKRETVMLRVSEEGGDDIEITLNTEVTPPYSASLSKTSFNYDDSGYIIIENFKGGDMVVDIETDCPHVKLNGHRFHLKERARIPFNVKVGTFASAQSFLSRQNEIHGSIYIAVDRRLFVLGMGQKLNSELKFIIAKPLEK